MEKVSNRWSALLRRIGFGLLVALLSVACEPGELPVGGSEESSVTDQNSNQELFGLSEAELQCFDTELGVCPESATPQEGVVEQGLAAGVKKYFFTGSQGDRFWVDLSKQLLATRNKCPAKIQRDSDGAEMLVFYHAATKKFAFWNAKAKTTRVLNRGLSVFTDQGVSRGKSYQGINVSLASIGPYQTTELRKAKNAQIKKAMQGVANACNW